MLNIHPSIPDELCESETCPDCGQTFYAPVGHDALKHHDESCEMAPEYDEEDDE